MNNHSIQSILDLLRDEQRADGAFPGTSPTIFGTLLTATILAELRDQPDAYELCMKSLSYIAAQRLDDGSYQYWERGSDEAMNHPYPPDLDDTALAAATELLADPKRFSGSAMARFVKLLTSAEAAEGGPYQTWLISDACDARWGDIDLGVNANIAFALSLMDIQLPNLERLFDEALCTSSYGSRYYHLPLLLLFFISRSYRGAHATEAITYILNARRADGIWGTATETASALCALSNFGHDISSYGDTVASLLASANTIPADPLYCERIDGSAVHYYANRSVSLSLIALAAHRYTKSKPSQQHSARTNEFESSIYAAFTESCSIAGYQTSAEAHVRDLRSKPVSSGAALLAYHYWNVMPDSREQVPLETVCKLSVAHLFGWIGYTIVDTVMDGEIGPAELPFALFCIRSFSAAYHELFPANRCRFFEEIMRDTEQAFAQEYADRLQRSGDGFLLESLSDRTPVSWQKSFGHALPALALVLLSGSSTDASAYLHTRDFFTQFLHARQLHDDAHDFIEDLAAGRVTIAGKLVLERFAELHPDQRVFSIPADEQELRTIFWQDCFPAVFELIESSIADAREQLRQMPIIDLTQFESLLSGLLRAQQKAYDERSRMLEFIETY